MEAYACIEQDGYSASFIYRPPIYDGPLALNASVGYKFAEVPRITNDLWVINLRATQAYKGEIMDGTILSQGTFLASFAGANPTPGAASIQGATEKSLQFHQVLIG